MHWLCPVSHADIVALEGYAPVTAKQNRGHQKLACFNNDMLHIATPALLCQNASAR